MSSSAVQLQANNSIKGAVVYQSLARPLRHVLGGEADSIARPARGRGRDGRSGRTDELLTDEPENGRRHRCRGILLIHVGSSAASDRSILPRLI